MKRCQVKECRRKTKSNPWPLCSYHKFLWNEYLNTLGPAVFDSFLNRGTDEESVLLDRWCKTQVAKKDKHER